MFHPKESTTWSHKQTLKDKLDMLSIDVGGSVSVELEMAKIEADGSFKYLTEKSVRNIFITPP